MNAQRGTTTLWRPTGPVELDLVRESGWRAWPPRLPEQPIFYPVPVPGTRFEVDAEFLRRYPVRLAGGRTVHAFR